MWQLPELKIDEILIYLRKSRADDPTLTVEEVLAKHEQMLDDWVARSLPELGAKVPEENRYREVVSGETIKSRPQMLKVLSRIESQQIKAILVVDPQRLSRGDLEDIGRLTKILRYTNTFVITLSEAYDLRGERDRDQFERELKRGNEFLEYQKRIMNNGRILSVQNGNFIGQYAPYGYKKVAYKDGKKKCFTLEPIPEEAQAVKLIFEMYLQGLGAEKISDRLHSLGVKPPKGERWAHTTIRTILGNEHYLGKVRWNRKPTVRTVENGIIKEHRPQMENYLVYPGKHEAIIDQETFDAVQKKRGSLPRTKKPSGLKNILAGIAFCSCGRSLFYHTYPKADPRYICRHQKYCGNASCLASELLDVVRVTLEEAIADFEVQVKKGPDSSLDVHRAMVARLEKRLAELEALEVAQWEKYTLEGMPKHIFDQLNKKVLEEKEEVQQALCTAKDSAPEPVDFKEKAATFREALEMLDDPEAPALELNTLLKQCIEHITYSRPKTTAPGQNRRYGTGQPFELDIKLRV